MDDRNFGGGETHLVTLSKQLLKHGITPVVVSNGGLYEAVFKEKGIKHFHTPLKNKRPLNAIRIVKMIKEIIKNEDIDIVHAHGRMPAFLGNLACKMTKTPFMTTAHAKVNNRFPYNILSVWGKEIIAVSEDIKTHLINVFNIDEKTITVIGNGIDLEIFKEAPREMAIEQELNLKPDSTRVVCISRIDGRLGELAIDLAKIVGKASGPKPVEAIIVGTGDKYEELVECVNSLPTDQQSRIHVLGRRSDVNKILTVADVAIAVSRSGIEAMASGKPVLIAGGEGYFGLLSLDNFDAAQEDFFTARNSAELYTADRFEKDLWTLIGSYDSQEVSEVVGHLKRVIEECYSLDGVTKQTIKVYERLLKGMN